MKKYMIAAAGTAAVLAGCSIDRSSNITESGLDPLNFVAETQDGMTSLEVLRNASGMEVAITNYGGRVVSIMVPDCNGKMTDVVLGHDSIADYINIDGNFGALIGRYGNRIANGCFTLDSVEYQLPRNNYGHCLHGGDIGFHHALWKVEEKNDTMVVMSLTTPDGYEGFPGEVQTTVTYTLRPDNALAINYQATTDAPTILNLTNHCYFNLGGDSSDDILDEAVWIDADAFTPIDSTFMTTGEIRNVEGTPFDFRTLKKVGRDIGASDIQLFNGRGYDHNFVINNPGDLSRPVARVIDPKTGIVLEVMTDEPGLQFYVGNFLDGSVKGKKGKVYGHRSALCLETQHFPDSPNKPEWPSVVIRPGETYTSNCIYRFSTNK